MSTPFSRDQAERLGRGAVAGVLLELNSAAGGRGAYAQARVVGGEGVIAGVLQAAGKQRVGVAHPSVVPYLERRPWAGRSHPASDIPALSFGLGVLVDHLVVAAHRRWHELPQLAGG